MTRRYEPAAGVSWLVCDEGVRVFRDNASQSTLLHYPEAALWDLLTRHAGKDRLRRMLGLITGQDPDAMSHWLDDMLDLWLHEGLIREPDKC